MCICQNPIIKAKYGGGAADGYGPGIASVCYGQIYIRKYTRQTFSFAADKCTDKPCYDKDGSTIDEKCDCEDKLGCCWSTVRGGCFQARKLSSGLFVVMCIC